MTIKAEPDEVIGRKGVSAARAVRLQSPCYGVGGESATPLSFAVPLASGSMRKAMGARFSETRPRVLGPGSGRLYDSKRYKETVGAC